MDIATRTRDILIYRLTDNKILQWEEDFGQTDRLSILGLPPQSRIELQHATPTQILQAEYEGMCFRHGEASLADAALDCKHHSVGKVILDKGNGANIVEMIDPRDHSFPLYFNTDGLR